MKPQEIRVMSDQELHDKLADAQQELMQLRFQKETHQVTNFARPRQVRKDIARFKTIMRERELEALLS